MRKLPNSLNMDEIKSLSRKDKAREYYQWVMSLRVEPINKPGTSLPLWEVERMIKLEREQALRKRLRAIKAEASDPKLVRDIVRNRFKKD